MFIFIVQFISLFTCTICTCLFNLFYLFVPLFLLLVCSIRSNCLPIVIHSEEHPTGFQSCPVVCSPEGVICGTYFFLFGYIGWKPGRKFRSRIRMDGSAVCTRDTTPRTEMGLKYRFAFLPCLINDYLFYFAWLILLLFI